VQLLTVNNVKCQAVVSVSLEFLFSVEEILEDLKAASPEDPVYTLNQELTRYSFPLRYSRYNCCISLFLFEMYGSVKV
jgi:hypothetical protein